MKKIILVAALIFAMVLPDVSFARGFSGGSHSSFSSGSRSSFSSSSSRSYSSPSRSYSSSSSSSKPSVNLSKSTTSKGSFSGSSSYKSAYSSSAKKTMTASSTRGSFSGASSTKSVAYRSGTVYRSTPTRAYYGGHYVSVSHYYHASFYHPFGYYSGFTTGMILGSFAHPWGGVYRVHGMYTSYGPSPLAWVADIIALLIFIFIIWVIYKAIRPKTSFRRKF